MTRAVPAMFKAVPVQMTAEVRACGGMPVNGALGVIHTRKFAKLSEFLVG